MSEEGAAAGPRMRIALVGPAHPYKGGAARHTTELAHHLAAAGHDVVIESWRALYPAALYPGVQTVEVAEGEPYPRTRRSLSWRRPDGWLAAGRRLRGDRDLVVFVFLVPVQVPAYLGIMRGLRGLPSVLGLRGRSVVPGRPGRRGAHGLRRRAARADAPRVVVICHNVLPHERRPGDVMLTRALLRRADAVLTHTERLASVARRLAPGTTVSVAAMPPHLPVPPGAKPQPADPRGVAPRLDEPPVAAPSAVAPPTASPAAQARPVASPEAAADVAGQRETGAVMRERAEPARRDAGRTASAGCRLLFFGIVRPYKGLDVLLRALALAPDELTLTVAGEFWGGLDATRALVSELGLTGLVTLRPGYVPAGEVGALLRAADALVLPYRSATASQNAWLAFEHGVPVIATRAGTFAEQVSDGVDGLLCEPADEADLARALRRFRAPGVAQRLRAGVRPVAACGLWAEYLDALLAVARGAARHRDPDPVPGGGDRGQRSPP